MQYRKILRSCPGAVALAIVMAGTVPVRAADEAPENWQLKFQSTAIGQVKPGFSAAYSGPNSLQTQRENSHSITATIFGGLRTWQGGELYLNPEMAMGVPMSDLKGLGGFTNGELARTSGPAPTFYRARAFVRQTWGLGGGTESLESEANQLGGSVDRKRLVLTAGNLSALDVFDDNQFSHEPRRQFVNWSLMTFGAWDYPADARGYTWGAALEYITPGWAVRAGRFEMPKDSNGLPLNSRIMSSYGDVAEFEKRITVGERAGRVRLLAFRNQAVMGSFRDAINAGLATGTTPDLTTVRTAQAKVGGGINTELEWSKDVGLFARASAGDGRTETFAFTEIDRSLSFGTVIKGSKWQRGEDEIGVAVAVNGLSSSHREYLARGGLGFFLGDGRLNYQSEQIFETYYSLKAARNFWLSLDYQYIRNPGYNADRGPANVIGLRLHLEL